MEENLIKNFKDSKINWKVRLFGSLFKKYL